MMKKTCQSIFGLLLLGILCVPVGATPSTAYVSNSGSGTVPVIYTPTNTVTPTIRVRSRPSSPGLSDPEFPLTGPLSPGQPVPCRENVSKPANDLVLPVGPAITHTPGAIFSGMEEK